MKRVIAVVFALCLLVSLAACGKPNNQSTEKKETMYVLTEQKGYQNGQPYATTTYQYDACGRPLEIRCIVENGDLYLSQLTYDANGNITQEKLSFVYAKTGETMDRQHNYGLTYVDGKLTHCDYTYNQDAVGGMDLSYDEKGNLVLVEYDDAYEEKLRFVWHLFEYDAEGRLIRETQCTNMSMADGAPQYHFSRIEYGYDADILSSIRHFAAITDYTVDHSKIGTVEFREIDTEYAFSTDKNGYLVYVGREPDPDYPNGQFSIFDFIDTDEFVFDEHGNLVKINNDGILWAEYTYAAIEVTSEEAQTAKQMMHGISPSMDGIYVCMDPLFRQLGPMMLYHAPISFVFYYLIPYPMW